MKVARSRSAFVVGLWALISLLGTIQVTRPAAAAPLAGAKTEIAQLLAYVESSGCFFNRNGSWYEPPQAAAHLREKFRMLSMYGQIATAADFIDKAATASSVSGRAYEVRCGAAPVISSHQWLYEELARTRACDANCAHPTISVPASTIPTTR